MLYAQIRKVCHILLGELGEKMFSKTNAFIAQNLSFHHSKPMLLVLKTYAFDAQKLCFCASKPMFLLIVPLCSLLKPAFPFTVPAQDGESGDRRCGGCYLCG